MAAHRREANWTTSPHCSTDRATYLAVVGATDDPAKFGGRIYRDLKAKGFRVRR